MRARAFAILLLSSLFLVPFPGAAAYFGPKSIEAPGLAHPVTAWGDCRFEPDSERGIAGCSAVIAEEKLSRPSRSIAYANRCSAYQLRGRMAEALADCDAAVKLDPSNFDGYYNRGRIYRKQKRYNQALADYTAAIRVARSDGKRAKALNNRGDVRVQKGNLDRAAADFDRAIALSSTYAKAFHNRAYIYAAKGELEQALRHYDTAIKLDPTLAITFVGRGYAYLRKNERERAAADFRRALTIDPDSKLVQAALRRAESGAGLGPASPHPEVEAMLQDDSPTAPAPAAQASGRKSQPGSR